MSEYERERKRGGEGRRWEERGVRIGESSVWEKALTAELPLWRTKETLGSNGPSSLIPQETAVVTSSYLVGIYTIRCQIKPS